MNSPKFMTESREEGALSEIQDNFRKIKSNRNQSFEEIFENLSLENDLLNFETKFDEFVGDSEDSTEISILISNLSSSNNFSNANLMSCENNQKAGEFDNDSENTEILNILKRQSQTTNNVSQRGFSHGSSSTNANQANSTKNSLNSIRPIPVKKISMAGRVLKSMDSTESSETISPEIKRRDEILLQNRPERSSNPMFKNNNFNGSDNKFCFFVKFQLNNL